MTHITNIETLSYDENTIEYEVTFSNKAKAVVSYTGGARPYPEQMMPNKCEASWIWYPGMKSDDDAWEYIGTYDSLDDFITTYVFLTFDSYKREDQP